MCFYASLLCCCRCLSDLEFTIPYFRYQRLRWGKFTSLQLETRSSQSRYSGNTSESFSTWTLANCDNSRYLLMHSTCSPRVVCWIATRKEIGSAFTKKASDYSTKRSTISTNSRTAIDSVRILMTPSFVTSRFQIHIQNSQPKRSWRWNSVQA